LGQRFLAGRSILALEIDVRADYAGSVSVDHGAAYAAGRLLIGLRSKAADRGGRTDAEGGTSGGGLLRLGM
jgi:hypothetical protein